MRNIKQMPRLYASTQNGQSMETNEQSLDGKDTIHNHPQIVDFLGVNMTSTVI